MANLDYPRMLFHRTQEPVTVHSRDEENALGPEWSRVIQPKSAPEPAPPPLEEVPHDPVQDDEPADDPPRKAHTNKPAPHRPKRKR